MPAHEAGADHANPDALCTAAVAGPTIEATDILLDISPDLEHRPGGRGRTAQRFHRVFIGDAAIGLPNAW